MAANDLNRPMRRKGRTTSASKRLLFAPALVAAALFLAIFAAFWIAVVDDPDGGRPVVVATIKDIPPSTGSISPDEPARDDGASAIGGAPAPGIELAALPSVPPAVGVDMSLLEQTAFGALPRVSPDGRRPRDVYSRHASAAAPGVPRIAIVVGGMGLSQTGTQKAIEALPEDITLAFAPYGSSLNRWVEKRARKAMRSCCRSRSSPSAIPKRIRVNIRCWFRRIAVPIRKI